MDKLENSATQQGAILLLSGPSGCGKSSLLKNLFQNIDHYYFSISTTTRSPRVGEEDGVDYFFVSIEEFKKQIEKKQFLEWAEVHGNYYGTSILPINEALEKNKLVIFDIDVQGFGQVKDRLGDITTSVFITTPTLDELEKRLVNRKTDTQQIIEKRIKNAKEEIEYIDQYDYILINDDLEIASSKLLALASIAKLKTSLIDKERFLHSWMKL
jgi:guanylate kinase